MSRIDEYGKVLRSKYGGGRQYSSKMEDIKRNHLERYRWAAGKLQASDRVLDAGCGVGYGSKILSGSCREVVGVDFDPGLVADIPESYRADNIKHATVDLNSLEGLPGGIFDTVVCFEVIEHLVHPESFLAGIQPRLASGAQILCSVPTTARPLTMYSNPYHMRHYTEDDFESLLLRCGWQIEEMHLQDFGPVGEAGAMNQIVARARSLGGGSYKVPNTSTVMRALQQRILDMARAIKEAP